MLDTINRNTYSMMCRCQYNTVVKTTKYRASYTSLKLYTSRRRKTETMDTKAHKSMQAWLYLSIVRLNGFYKVRTFCKKL